jgi:hypothetical protein
VNDVDREALHDWLDERDGLAADERPHPSEYEDREHDPCPMGCGRTTEDPYGGPCKACWELVT